MPVFKKKQLLLYYDGFNISVYNMDIGNQKGDIHSY